MSIQNLRIIPFKGTARDNITAGYNNYITDTGNTKTFLIDLGSNGVTYTSGQYAYDGLHPNVLGNQLAELIYQAMLTNVDTTAPVTDVDVDEVAAACSPDPITVTSTVLMMIVGEYHLLLQMVQFRLFLQTVGIACFVYNRRVCCQIFLC